MTHKDIYTKFMIEYEKADSIEHKPQLTEYEVAVVLDKAYNALIAQKVSGNNYRRTPFEGDLKSIEDLAPLVTQAALSLSDPTDVTGLYENVRCTYLPDTYLYFIDGHLLRNVASSKNSSRRKMPSNSTVLYNASKDNTTAIDPEIWAEGYMIPTVELMNNKDKYKEIVLSCSMFKTFVLWYVWFDNSKYDEEDEDPIGWTATNTGRLNMDYTITDDVYEFIENHGGTEGCPAIFITPEGDYNDYETPLVVYGVPEEQSTTPDDDDHVVTGNGPIDGNPVRMVPVQLVTHQIAKNFFASAYNLPWIKNPVCYIESGIDRQDKLYVVYDPYKSPSLSKIYITYIRKPNTFTKDLKNVETYKSFFDWGKSTTVPDEYKFECNDTFAEELVSLAITFILENTESQRLNSKLNMRGLEA